MYNAPKKAKKLKGIKDWIKDTEVFHEAGDSMSQSSLIDDGTFADEWTFYKKHRVKPDFPSDDRDDIDFGS